MKILNLATIETSGQHMIEASAGTGKTWTIAALYILLLLESRLRPEEILVRELIAAAAPAPDVPPSASGPVAEGVTKPAS